MPANAGYFLAADDLLFIGADQPTTIRVMPESGLLEYEEAEPGIHHWKSGGQKKKYKTAHPVTYQFSAVGKGRATVEFFWADGKEVKTRKIVIECQGARPPPEPIPPDPKPPEPTPVTSFRVIFVVETGNTITAAQNSVIYGKAVEDWMTANCTGGKDGWRRRDKDATEGKDTTTMNALWAAVKPKVTSTPCVAVERNGKVEIIPVAATPADMLATFKRYLEGK